MKRMNIAKTKHVKIGDIVGSKLTKQEIDWNDKYSVKMLEDQDTSYSSEIGSKTISQFQSDLKKLDPRLYIVFNKTIADPLQPTGHPIRYYDDTLPEKFDIVDAVGISGKSILPAQNQFVNVFNPDKNIHETKFICKGWSIVLDTVYAFLVKRGIHA